VDLDCSLTRLEQKSINSGPKTGKLTTTRMLSNNKVSEGEGVSEGCVVLMEL